MHDDDFHPVLCFNFNPDELKIQGTSGSKSVLSKIVARQEEIFKYWIKYKMCELLIVQSLITILIEWPENTAEIYTRVLNSNSLSSFVQAEWSE